MLRVSLADILNDKSGLQFAEALYGAAQRMGRARFERVIQSQLKPDAELLTPSLIYLLMVAAQKALHSEEAKHAADKGHDQAGGTRDKRAKVLKAWATGEYKTHIDCVKKVHDKIGISYDTAIKALRNAPKPNKPLPSKG